MKKCKDEEMEMSKIVFDTLAEAETRKTKGSNANKMYWQGRTDGLRIVIALLYDGIAFGIDSGQHADLLSENDLHLIAEIKGRQYAISARERLNADMKRRDEATK